MMKIVAPIPSPVADLEKAVEEYTRRHGMSFYRAPLPDPKALLLALVATVKDAHKRIEDLVAERVEAGAAADETAKLVSELKNRVRDLEAYLRLDPPPVATDEAPTAHLVDVGAATRGSVGTLTNCGRPGPSGAKHCLGHCTLHPESGR